MADSRSSSRRPASISSWAPASLVDARASSSRSRSPLSGVRSWCEASATNSPLAGDEPLEPRGHVVERAGQAALLGAALHGRAGREVTLGHPAGGLVEPPDRPGHLPGDQGPGGEPEHEHEQADRDQAARGAPRGAADRVDALGHPHGADRVGSARAPHRHRGGEDRLVERLAAALLLVGAVRESDRDLRPRAVVHAQPLLPVRVGKQPTLGADDDHAPAHRLGGPLGDPVERLAGCEVALDARRHDLRLAERLGLDLGVHALPQADDERHLERDDRQHEHVGERQQEAGAEAYVSSSGAVKRKPTPRTVCR